MTAADGLMICRALAIAGVLVLAAFARAGFQLYQF